MDTDVTFFHVFTYVLLLQQPVQCVLQGSDVERCDECSEAAPASAASTAFPTVPGPAVAGGQLPLPLLLSDLPLRLARHTYPCKLLLVSMGCRYSNGKFKQTKLVVIMNLLCTVSVTSACKVCFQKLINTFAAPSNILLMLGYLVNQNKCFFVYIFEHLRVILVLMCLNIFIRFLI